MRMPDWFKNYLDSLSQERAQELWDWARSRKAVAAWDIGRQLEDKVTMERRPK